MLIFVFAVSLAVSVFLNVLQLLKSKKTKRTESYDAAMLLRDLLNGEGLVKVTRVAPENLFIRSPRDL